MNKITYTKHCEFCGTEFTTPIHLRRYCSKCCVRAAYKKRLKEKKKSDDKILFDKVWAQTSVTLPEKGWITIEQVCNEFHMNRSFARLQLAVHQITRRTSGNTTYYSRQEIINVKGASGGRALKKVLLTKDSQIYTNEGCSRFFDILHFF